MSQKKVGFKCCREETPSNKSFLFQRRIKRKSGLRQKKQERLGITDKNKFKVLNVSVERTETTTGLGQFVLSHTSRLTLPSIQHSHLHFTLIITICSCCCSSCYPDRLAFVVYNSQNLHFLAQLPAVLV